VVAWPGTHVSTKWAYGRLDRSLTKLHCTPMIRPFAGGYEPRRAVLVNDLEPVVAAAYPEILSIKGKLLTLGATGSLMSGSGSACFGLFSSRHSATRAAATLRRAGVWARAVRTLSERPPLRVR
jgi:4-diphosphocytidyl-2-C-methyl-D-erythritol kinase